MIRTQEKDKKFKEALQNPPKPINDDTGPSQEMEEYLDDLNDGNLKSEETLKKEKKNKKGKEENKKYKLFCPTCKRQSLKRAPQGYACGFCGLSTNTPLRMAE